jgi:hypothetical protein
MSAITFDISRHRCWPRSRCVGARFRGSPGWGHRCHAHMWPTGIGAQNPLGVSISRLDSPAGSRSDSGKRTTRSKRRLPSTIWVTALALNHLLQRAQQRAGGHAITRHLLVVQADFDLRNQHLLFDLQVGDAGTFGPGGCASRRLAAQGVQVVAVYLERNLGPHAREQVVQPVRDGLAHVAAGGQHGQTGCGCRQ